jgi:hypothetical protein
LAGKLLVLARAEELGRGESAGARDPPLAVAWRRRDVQRGAPSSVESWGTGHSRPFASRRGGRLRPGAGGKMKISLYTDEPYRRVERALRHMFN